MELILQDKRYFSTNPKTRDRLRLSNKLIINYEFLMMMGMPFGTVGESFSWIMVVLH